MAIIVVYLKLFHLSSSAFFFSFPVKRSLNDEEQYYLNQEWEATSNRINNLILIKFYVDDMHGPMDIIVGNGYTCSKIREACYVQPPVS